MDMEIMEELVEIKTKKTFKLPPPSENPELYVLRGVLSFSFPHHEEEDSSTNKQEEKEDAVGTILAAECQDNETAEKEGALVTQETQEEAQELYVVPVASLEQATEESRENREDLMTQELFVPSKSLDIETIDVHLDIDIDSLLDQPAQNLSTPEPEERIEIKQQKQEENLLEKPSFNLKELFDEEEDDDDACGM